MATLPTVPSFTAGSPTIAQLNRLSQAVSFLANNGTRPAWSVFMYNGTQTLTASSWNVVGFDHVAYDSDGVTTSSKSVLTIATQGYYDLEACVQLQAQAGTGLMFNAGFLFTAGGSNPHFSLGATQYFGYSGSRMSSTAQAAADNASCIASITPMVCYPGDKLNVSVYSASALVIDYNQNTSFIRGRFATKFTGRWSREGV